MLREGLNQNATSYPNIFSNSLRFEDFKSAPWNTCERKLIKWGQHNCTLEAAQSVQMFVFVVAIPSTLLVPSEMRYFGQSDFSAYLDDSELRGNAPKGMWTIASALSEQR